MKEQIEMIQKYSDWCREYPGISQALHFSILSYLVSISDKNLSGLVIPSEAMGSICINKKDTWRSKFNDLVKWGWIEVLPKKKYHQASVPFRVTNPPVERVGITPSNGYESPRQTGRNHPVKRVGLKSDPPVKRVGITPSNGYESPRQTGRNHPVKRVGSELQTPDLQYIAQNVDNSPSRARAHVITTTIEDNNSISKSSSSSNAREKKVGIGPLKNVFLSEGLLRRAKEICKEHFEECVAMVGDWKESKRDATGVLPVSNDFKGVTDWALAECIKRKENQLKTLEKNAIKNNTNSNNQRDPRIKHARAFENNENGYRELYEAAWSCNYNAGYGDIPDDVVFRFRPDPRIHGKTMGKDEFRRFREELNNRYRNREGQEREMASDEARGIR